MNIRKRAKSWFAKVYFEPFLKQVIRLIVYVFYVFYLRRLKRKFKCLQLISNTKHMWILCLSLGFLPKGEYRWVVYFQLDKETSCVWFSNAIYPSFCPFLSSLLSWIKNEKVCPQELPILHRGVSFITELTIIQLFTVFKN